MHFAVQRGDIGLVEMLHEHGEQIGEGMQMILRVMMMRMMMMMNDDDDDDDDEEEEEEEEVIGKEIERMKCLSRCRCECSYTYERHMPPPSHHEEVSAHRCKILSDSSSQR